MIVDRVEMSDLVYTSRVIFFSMFFVNPGWIE